MLELRGGSRGTQENSVSKLTFFFLTQRFHAKFFQNKPRVVECRQNIRFKFILTVMK